VLPATRQKLKFLIWSPAETHSGNCLVRFSRAFFRSIVVEWSWCSSNIACCSISLRAGKGKVCKAGLVALIDKMIDADELTIKAKQNFTSV